jgi:hypothetical protein
MKWKDRKRTTKMYYLMFALHTGSVDFRDVCTGLKLSLAELKADEDRIFGRFTLTWGGFNFWLLANANVGVEDQVMECTGEDHAQNARFTLTTVYTNNGRSME